MTRPLASSARWPRAERQEPQPGRGRAAAVPVRDRLERRPGGIRAARAATAGVQHDQQMAQLALAQGAHQVFGGQGSGGRVVVLRVPAQQIVPVPAWTRPCPATYTTTTRPG
ncbi:hypothetical protein [Streptomyces sp. BRA346]|uniref:hypothetical protein n=1 Tax=Streptomyces sp. BRA346 TaxID=2878199 RepID=UPI00406485BE